MKRFLPILALLIAPQLAFAQPDVKPQPDAKFQPDPATYGAILGRSAVFAANPDNQRAVAMMGAFFHAVSMAKSYRGHFIYTGKSAKEGKPTSTTTLDWESTWRRGDVFQTSGSGFYSTTADGKETRDDIQGVDDGKNSYHLYSTRGVWSQRPTTKDAFSDFSQMAVNLPWLATMMQVLIAPDLKIEKGEGETTVISSSDGKYQATFGADGLLKEFKTHSDDGDEAQLRIDRLELNVPVEEDSFKWKAPTNARQVAPSEVSVDYNLNFNF